MSDVPPEFRPLAGPRVAPRTVGIVAAGLAGIAVLAALVSAPGEGEQSSTPATSPSPRPDPRPTSAGTWPARPATEDPLAAATSAVEEAVAARARAEISLERARAGGADPDVLEALEAALRGRPSTNDEGPAQLDAAGALDDRQPGIRASASERAL